MARSVVGLLAAVGATLSVLAGMIHGHLEPFALAGAAISAGLAASMALPPSKKI
jgi:hypothetical protein